MTHLIGKAETEVDMDLHVLDCRSRAAATVRMAFKFDAAIQGSEQESFRRAGVESGKGGGGGGKWEHGGCAVTEGTQ